MEILGKPLMRNIGWKRNKEQSESIMKRSAKNMFPSISKNGKTPWIKISSTSDILGSTLKRIARNVIGVIYLTSTLINCLLRSSKFYRKAKSENYSYEYF